MDNHGEYTAQGQNHCTALQWSLLVKHNECSGGLVPGCDSTRKKSDVGETPEWDVCGSVVNARKMAAEWDMNM